MHRVEDLGFQAEGVAGKLDFRAELWAAERCLDDQVTAAAVVTEVLDAEGEPIDFASVEDLQHRQGNVLSRGGEVQVGGEASGVAGAELPQRGAALEHQVLGEKASLVDQVESVVLRDVQNCGVSTALHALVVAREVAFGDPAHAPVPTVR
jgi:hypothetical protein